MGRSKTLRQCYALQDLVFNAANQKDISKPDLAKLALAWERLIERQRILRGKPLPGSLRPSGKSSRGRGRALIIGPMVDAEDVSQLEDRAPAEPFPPEPPDDNEALGS